MFCGAVALVASGDAARTNALGPLVALVGSACLWLLFARRLRAGLWLKTFAGIELLAAALAGGGPVVFLCFGFFLIFLAASAAAGEIERSASGNSVVVRGGLRRFNLRLAGITFLAVLGILTLTAGFFFVLPRTAHAALGHLGMISHREPFFSPRVRLDRQENLRRRAAIMHVRIVEGKAPATLRWRGAVLSWFDGRSWFAQDNLRQWVGIQDGRSIVASDDQRRRPGPRLTYEVQLEPLASDALFLAGIPEVIWIGEQIITRSPGEVYRLHQPTRLRLRYGAISHLDPVLPTGSPLPADLELPPGIDPRVRRLAGEIVAGAQTSAQKAAALEQYLRHNFRYGINSRALEADDPVADFLFRTRQGHCELFASALAVMLRTQDIPARMVTGFLGGTMNPVSGWLVVETTDAHAWVEAYVDGKGWMTFDPTPPAPVSSTHPLLARLWAYSDVAGMFWQEWVVSYDLQRQAALALGMLRSGRSLLGGWRETILPRRDGGLGTLPGNILLVAGIVLGLSVLALAAVWIRPALRRAWRLRSRLRRMRGGQVQAADATLLYLRLLALLKQRGYLKPSWKTPAEFIQDLKEDSVREIVAGFTAAYHDLRFGGDAGAALRMLAYLDRLGKLV